MDALTMLKEWNRMCTTVKECWNCPLKSCSGCVGAATPEAQAELIETIETWAVKNPQKTILDEFKEKYPRAYLDHRGAPSDICPDDLGYSRHENCGQGIPLTCLECWNRPLEGETEAEK